MNTKTAPLINDKEADLSGFALDELLSMVDDEQILVNAVPAALPPARIAIIGMAGKIAGCADLNAFWETLRDSRMTRRILPEARRADVQEFLRLKGVQRPVEYFRESFLSDIDQFDYRFFGIAKQEANLIDPSQRLFLETAWSALEHAGYGGKSIKGSNTGVYVGHGGDFGNAYRDIVRALAPDAPEIAVVGNVRSIIASRIAYHLDLHGPSIMVDTACSSGLVALHLACRALLAGDCDMALAGTVKVDLIPVVEDRENCVGIKAMEATVSSDGRTKTFDDDCEGTAGAEGVVVFVLKALDRALADGDTIHAVILGSAVNQDGQSVGITAPNLAAQESLIVSALKNADVSPESVSYIEAHGTATRLGDPIEVSGIQRAFRQFTKRRQFCAIGTVKSNIGHMDSGSGLAGLAKVVLSMKHRQLPASLNFNRPNRNITFKNSPIFVNDILRPWIPIDGAPLRAGINSYGLSGTNCHVIVEAAAPLTTRAATPLRPHLLPISAANEAALLQLALAYESALRAYDGAAEDLCFTAALGRQHHSHRLALVFNDVAHLRTLLASVAAGGGRNGAEHIFFGSVRMVNDKRLQSKEPGVLDESAKRALDRQAEELSERYQGAAWQDRPGMMVQAAAMYAQGADVPWELWFDHEACRRIPLPTYPFARTRCWVETTEMGERATKRSHTKHMRHPLLDRCAARSHGLRLYEANLGVASHWELAEHKVKGMYVLPGTALVEMILEVSAHINGGQLRPLQIEQLVFLRPFMLADQQARLIQLSLTESEGAFRLQIVSLRDADGDEWDVHAEGLLKIQGATSPAPLDLARLKALLPESLGLHRNESARRGGLEVGDRWQLSFQQGWSNLADDQFLIHLALPATYHAEAPLYHFHPALLDTAVNAVNHLAGDDGLYLPFSYKRLEVFKRLPIEFYVYLRKKPGASAEAFHLDIDIIDMQGEFCAHVHEYAIKRAPASVVGDALESHMHFVQLVASIGSVGAAMALDAPILLVRHADSTQMGVAEALRSTGATVVELIKGEAAAAGEQARLDLAAYENALCAMEGSRFGGVVYALGWESAVSDGAHLASKPATVVHDLVDFVSAFLKHKLRSSGSIVILSKGAFMVDAHSLPVQPHLAALAALARIVRIENPQLRFRCVDSDTMPTGQMLLGELGDQNDKDLSVYRQGVCYRERLESLPRFEHTHFSPRREGVYLITGGFGALGLELARHMAKKGAVNLALVSTTALPPQDQWQGIVKAGLVAEKTLSCLRHLLQLVEMGATLTCIAADVADGERMQQVLAQLRTDFGCINGVVHAAGRGGEGFLQNKTRERFERVLAPKMEGAKVLHELTLTDPLDFFVMYSSIVTVIRTPGQSDYTAANAYLDALAHFRRAQGLPATSICWPAWREVGMALEFGAVNEEEFLAPIDNATALDLLEQVLADDGALPPVLILSEINAKAKLEQIDALGLELSEPMRKRLRRSANLRTKNDANEVEGGAQLVLLQGLDGADEIAQTVAKIWSRVLGTAEFGADEGFAEHGGNSILTTQMYREFEILYPGALDVVDLFTHTTIREQAELIRSSLGGRAPSAPAADDATNLDHVLALLAGGQLSADDADSLLLM